MLLGVSLFVKLIVTGQIKLGQLLPTVQKSLLDWVDVGKFTPSTSVSILAKERKEKCGFGDARKCLSQ